MGFVLGGLQAGLSAAFEEKPDVPEFRWVDLVQKQLDTAQGNLDVLPLSEELGASVNEFMRGERAKTLAGVPGLEDIETQTVENLKRWLSGELGDDLTSAVTRGSNARAFAGGYRGSGMGRNLEARDLGLTGLQLQQAGTQLGGQFLNAATARRAIPEFNPASMFIDPMAAAEFEARQNAARFNRDWLSERIKAQPEPWQQSLMDSAAAGSAMGDTLLMSYAGGAMGGGGGMMGGIGSAAPAGMAAQPAPVGGGGSYLPPYNPYI